MKFVTDLSKGVLGKPDSPVLWDQILSNVTDEMLLKPDFKALVVACGHCTEAVLLVKRMQSLRIPDSRIQDAIWVLDKYSVFTNQARKYGFKNVITQDFLEWDPKGMKFDLVMGNPPYQHPGDSKGQKMWCRFIKKMADQVTQDGYLVMITPTSWVKGGNNDGKWGVLKNLFAEKQLVLAVMDRVNSFFLGIGVEIGWWVMKNAPNSQPSKFVLSDGIFERYLSENTILSTDGRISNSIVNKVLVENREKFIIHYFGNKGITKDESDKPTTEFPYPHWVMGSDQTNDLCIRYKKSTLRTDLACKKIVFPISNRYWNPYYDNQGVSVMSQGFVVVLSDDDNKDGAYSVFYSKLFKYLCFNLQIAKNGFMKTNMVRALPKLDLTRTWTDEELYAHFGLTDEEIRYIEEQVK